MKGVFVSLLSLSVFAFTSFAKPVPKPDGHDEWLDDLQKRAGTYAITGAPNGNNPRYEIHDFMFNHPWMFALFMNAMARFQSLNQGSQFSYYLVAGIHGVPNVPWDGVQANPASNGAVGYCVHGSQTFPTFHRPYVALFEMQFYINCQAVAAQFQGTQWATQINTALKTIKFPYWDWAAAPPSGLSSFPALFSSPTWNYLTPTGSKNMPNPMYQYNFHPLNANDMIYQPWSEWTYTRRYPTSDSDPNAQSQESMVTSTFQQNRVNLRDNVYNMFTSCGQWTEFSNDAASSSTPGCHTSLEGIHDNIHSWVGGSNDGHMTYLWWAAFDPVFWMHHCNVDRLFAMWQVIYPNTYVGNFNAPGSTFTIAKGQPMSANSPLDPFHSNTNGASWTSNGVRNIGVFQYTYPEIQQANGNANTMKTIVNNLYGPNSPSNSKAKRSTAPQTNFEYIANVQSQRFTVANGSSYQVYFFFGNPPTENSLDWVTAPNLIGSQAFFSQPGMQNNNMTVTGAVPLTSVLHSKLSSGLLKTLSSTVVTPLLKMFLEWRVVTSSGTIIDPDTIDDFLVSVVYAEVQPATSSNPFPTYSQWTSLGDITHGKPGGLPLGGKCAGEL